MPRCPSSSPRYQFLICYGSPSGNHPNCAIETLYLPPLPLTTTPFPPISTTSTPSSRSLSICLSAPRPLSARGEMYPLDAITLCWRSRVDISAAPVTGKPGKTLTCHGTVLFDGRAFIAFPTCLACRGYPASFAMWPYYCRGKRRISSQYESLSSSDTLTLVTRPLGIY